MDAAASEFSQDTEFPKLVARMPDVDLTIAALEIARDADPNIEFSPVTEWINDRARDIFSAVSRSHTEMEALRELGQCLSQRFGLSGNSECYQSTDSSYLHRVIQTGQGIPISLSLVYMAVAGKVGLELHGVASPSHFLTRYESVDGPLFIDAFSEGRLMNESECIQWISSIAQLAPAQVRPLLRAVGARVIITRVLNNLKILHAQKNDWQLALKVQKRLRALHPGSYEEQRDLALIMSRTPQSGQALSLLEECLQVCPDSDKTMLKEQIRKSQSNHARWN